MAQTSGPVSGRTIIKSIDNLQWLFSSPRRILWQFAIMTPIIGAIVAPISFDIDGKITVAAFMTAAVFIIPSVVLMNVMVVACVIFNFIRLSPAQKDMIWVIDESRILLRDAADTEVSIPWKIVKRFQVKNGGFLLSLRPAGVRWIPARAFDEVGSAAIIEFAKEAGALKGKR